MSHNCRCHADPEGVGRLWSCQPHALLPGQGFSQYLRPACAGAFSPENGSHWSRFSKVDLAALLTATALS